MNDTDKKPFFGKESYVKETRKTFLSNFRKV